MGSSHKAHTDPNCEKLLQEKIQGLQKRYDALGVLNQIMPKLVSELEVKYFNNVYLTTGKITSNFRKQHDLYKDHFLDAYCIACSVIDMVKIS